MDPKKKARIEIFVGESNYIKDNNKLEMFEVPLEGKKKGEERVEIRVKIDENGIITVYADAGAISLDGTAMI